MFLTLKEELLYKNCALFPENQDGIFGKKESEPQCVWRGDNRSTLCRLTDKRFQYLSDGWEKMDRLVVFRQEICSCWKSGKK